MKIATIDIGTNTILLLISDIDKVGNIRTLHHEQRIPRIGKDVDKDGNIGPEAFKRASTILNEYKNIISPYKVEKVIVTGTSAIRDAKNNSDFQSHILEETGLILEIINGEEEAKWTYRGGVSELVKDNTGCAVIDIGGGSTEIIIGEGKEIKSKISLNIGAVRLTERFLKNNPPLNIELDSAIELVRSELAKINHSLKVKSVIGVAGTITTLAAYHQKLEFNDPEKVNGYIMSLYDIDELYNELKVKSVIDISRIKSIPKGREDVILAGTLILREFMNYYSIKEIMASVRGLRYGIAIREWEKI